MLTSEQGNAYAPYGQRHRFARLRLVPPCYLLSQRLTTLYSIPSPKPPGCGRSHVFRHYGRRLQVFRHRHATPIVQAGKPGDEGYLEFSDIFVSSQGPTAGAVLIEYNLETYTGSNCKLTSQSTPPSGMWDVHTRYARLSSFLLHYQS